MFLQLAAALALLSLGVSAAVLSIDAHHFYVHLDRTVQDVDAAVKVQSVDLAQDEMHLDSVLQSIDSAATEQRSYWQKTSADSDKTVKALRIAVDRASLLMKHTDEQLNTKLLPDVDRNVSDTALSAQSAISSVDHAADALTFQIMDLGPAFANLNEGSARMADALGNLQSASQHADKILLDGEKTADYYEKKLTTPASFAHRLAMTTLDIGSKAGNIMAGFVK